MDMYLVSVRINKTMHYESYIEAHSEDEARKKCIDEYAQLTWKVISNNPTQIFEDAIHVFVNVDDISNYLSSNVIINVEKVCETTVGDYFEIKKLKQMLINAGIPFAFRFLRDGYQIIISKNNVILCDAIENEYSNGAKSDKLEIMGGLTLKEEEKSNILGWLIAEEVFKRFKYCYENNTRIYELI